jgi:hypothetical protein
VIYRRAASFSQILPTGREITATGRGIYVRLNSGAL